MKVGSGSIYDIRDLTTHSVLPTGRLKWQQ